MQVSQFSYSPQDFLALLAHMAAIGKPLCVVKILCDSEALSVSQIKKVSPQTIVVIRVYRDSDGGPDLTAPEFFRIHIDPYSGRHGADFYQIYNEWDDTSPHAIQFRQEQLVWCENHSGDYLKRLLDPGWSTGYPGGEPMATYSQGYILDHLRYIRDHGHAFSLDEYYRNDLDWELFRFFDKVFPFLPDDLRNNMPQTIFAEWGQENIANLTYNDLLSLFRNWNAKIIKYPFVKGVCVYALGDSIGWANYNIARNMGVLAEL